MVKVATILKGHSATPSKGGIATIETLEDALAEKMKTGVKIPKKIGVRAQDLMKTLALKIEESEKRAMKKIGAVRLKKNGGRVNNMLTMTGCKTKVLINEMNLDRVLGQDKTIEIVEVKKNGSKMMLFGGIEMKTNPL